MMDAKLHKLKTPSRRRTRADRVASLILTLLLAAIALGAGAVPVSAADELEIELALDKHRIELGRQASLTMTVIGPSGFTEPAMPEVDGLDIIPRGRSQSVQIINMKVRSSKIFGYKIEPHRAGEFMIGPVHIKRRGKVYTSNTVKLTVLEPARTSESADQPKVVIVEVTVDNANPYVGQQITLLIRFAQRVGARIRNASYQLPDLKDFWNEGIENKREYRRDINGVDYTVTEVAVPLFPIKEGATRIDGIRFNYDELIPQDRSRSRPFPSTDQFGENPFDDDFFDRFFRSDRAARKQARTPPIEIDVRPLPLAGRPPAFKGGVGSFSIEADLSEEVVKEGESVTLTVTLSGQGNIRDVADPDFEIEGVKTYADTPTVRVKAYNDKVVGEKVYKLALVPQQAERMKMPNISTPYFNPETGRYELASSGALVLNVLPSKDEELEFVSPSLRRRAKARAGAARPDILPIHERYGTIERGRFEMLWPRLRPVVYPLPVILYALCFAVVRHRRKLHTDVEYRRQRFASRTADSSVRAAERASRHKDWDEVFTRCSRAVTEFLADKLNVPTGGLTPADVGSILAERGVPDDFRAEIVKFLEGCDYGRFASPSESPEVAGKCIEGARKLLGRLKREEAIK